MDGWYIDRWKRLMTGLMDGWFMSGWMDGWMAGWIIKWINHPFKDYNQNNRVRTDCIMNPCHGVLLCYVKSTVYYSSKPERTVELSSLCTLNSPHHFIPVLYLSVINQINTFHCTNEILHLDGQGSFLIWTSYPVIPQSIGLGLEPIQARLRYRNWIQPVTNTEADWHTL